MSAGQHPTQTITGQVLANTLDGFERIASMNPPPGAAYQAAVSALPPPETNGPAASRQYMHNFNAGLGF